MKLKIEKIFQQSMTSKQSIPFVFVPKCKDKRAVGLLLSSDVELSLSFQNGTGLKLNCQSVFQTSHSAPNRRIIPLDEPLHEILKGVVIAGDFTTKGVARIGTGKARAKGGMNGGIKGQKQMSVYLIIEQE